MVRPSVADWFAGNVLEYVDGYRNRPDASFPFHDHPCHEIVYHPQGRGKTTLQDGREIPFEQGGVVFYKPFDRHSQTVSTPALDVVIQFTGKNLPPPMQVSRGFRPFPQHWVNDTMMELSRRAHKLPREERLLLNHRVSTLVMALFTLGESYEQTR
ncbi:MAG TPA: cupin domain-containing protein, partial [Spirochaetia bacterium]|nr:cupin domain-containing protein [Spirochaetia bacterium]